MRLFLLVIFSIYGAVHAYAFLKVRAAFPLGVIGSILLGMFMAAMTVSPVMVRILEKYGYGVMARSLSWVAYTWMGVLFLFFSISLLTDVLRLTARMASIMLRTDLSWLMPSSTQAFVIPLLLALVLAVYSFYEALHIRPEMMTIRSARIPPEAGTIRIAQISDVHLGLIVREDRLRRILGVIQEARPDIIVSTGDFVDGQIDAISGLAEIFGGLTPRYGKYAVTGNHEFYAGIDHSLEVTRTAGFTVLRNEAVSVAGIIIAGADDPTGRRFGLTRPVSEHDMLSSLSRGTYTILLKHLPVARENSAGLFDLQLSGHTHRGQLFPFRFMVRLFFSYISGTHDLPGGSRLHVSRGTGTWGPPMRFLAPPEVTIIDLVHDPGQ